MANPKIEEFARVLVQQVRDATIRSCDGILRPNATHAIAKRWKEHASGGNLESIAHTIIPDVVDDAIFHLLLAIDEGHLKLAFTASNGKKVDLLADGLGELAGWYMGSGGWRALYSEQRHIDDFSDLK